MIDYVMELRMADKNLPITDKMEKLLCDCAKEAGETTVSRKNKRTFAIERRLDEYALLVRLQSRDAINPTRTMSTLTRAVIRNNELYSLVKDHMVNGLIFHLTLVDEQNTQIIHIPDPEIIAEIVSMFFKNDFAPKEKVLAEVFCEKIRAAVLEYKNEQRKL